MDEGAAITLSEGMARMAVRLEALEHVVVTLAARLRGNDQALLSAIDAFQGPGHVIVGGRRYDITPEHREAAASAAQALADRIRRLTH